MVVCPGLVAGFSSFPTQYPSAPLPWRPALTCSPYWTLLPIYPHSPIPMRAWSTWNLHILLNSSVGARIPLLGASFCNWFGFPSLPLCLALTLSTWCGCSQQVTDLVNSIMIPFYPSTSPIPSLLLLVSCYLHNFTASCSIKAICFNLNKLYARKIQ